MKSILYAARPFREQDQKYSKTGNLKRPTKSVSTRVPDIYIIGFIPSLIILALLIRKENGSELLASLSVFDVYVCHAMPFPNFVVVLLDRDPKMDTRVSWFASLSKIGGVPSV
jgi:hypothetical protein